jgi:KUP system potassium uptake protein
MAWIAGLRRARAGGSVAESDSETTTVEPNPASPGPSPGRLALTLAALGVVFGDIGTSPLYALRECFGGAHAFPITPDNVLGIVSLILWAVTLIVSVKYVLIVMRADNRGDGGILALMALVAHARKEQPRRRMAVILIMGVLGAALLYSDGVITPAISVLSAVEGLTRIKPDFGAAVVPVSLVILIALFLVQSRGTARVGALFGPVLCLWFAALAALGVAAIVRNPVILAALNPLYAVRFFAQHGLQGFVVLGSVFLAVTGAEVLYADLGHFGRAPIRRAWFSLVFPALVLNYMGQGAYLLGPAPVIENLFYQIVPPALLYPMVILATCATVIASQAVISGAFSLARQSVQLGFWPRLKVQHTSKSTLGQVYVPLVNWALLLGTLLLILVFRESGRLAAAYGIAVSADMVITSVLISLIARQRWGVRLAPLLAVAAVFLMIELAFFGANVLKVASGGWIVIAIALLLGTLMKTWLDGRVVLRRNMDVFSLDLDSLPGQLERHPPHRVVGTAVFLSANPAAVPRALLHNLKHNKVLHEHTVVLSVTTVEMPAVTEAARTQVRALGHGLFQITLSYGFSEIPDVPRDLAAIRRPDLPFDPMDTTYFLGRETRGRARQSVAGHGLTSAATPKDTPRAPSWPRSSERGAAHPGRTPRPYGRSHALRAPTPTPRPLRGRARQSVAFHAARACPPRPYGRSHALRAPRPRPLRGSSERGSRSPRGRARQSVAQPSPSMTRRPPAGASWAASPTRLPTAWSKAASATASRTASGSRSSRSSACSRLWPPRRRWICSTTPSSARASSRAAASRASSSRARAAGRRSARSASSTARATATWAPPPAARGKRAGARMAAASR